MSIAQYRYPQFNSMYKKSPYLKKPKTDSKLAKENRDRFVKEIKQLNHILDDTDYLEIGNNYRDFVVSMFDAIVNGRNISVKMESAIQGIISRYAKWFLEKNNPKYQEQRKIFVDESMKKIKLIKDTLFDAKYSTEYESGAEYFLNSVGEQVKKKGELTLKQKESLNKMYNRFKKRVEKNTKKSKKNA